MNASGSYKNIKKNIKHNNIVEWVRTGKGKQCKMIGLSFVKEKSNKSYIFFCCKAYFLCDLLSAGWASREGTAAGVD